MIFFSYTLYFMQRSSCKHFSVSSCLYLLFSPFGCSCTFIKNEDINQEAGVEKSECWKFSLNLLKASKSMKEKKLIARENKQQKLNSAVRYMFSHSLALIRFFVLTVP